MFSKNVKKGKFKRERSMDKRVVSKLKHNSTHSSRFILASFFWPLFFLSEKNKIKKQTKVFYHRTMWALILLRDT